MRIIKPSLVEIAALTLIVGLSLPSGSALAKCIPETWKAADEGLKAAVEHKDKVLGAAPEQTPEGVKQKQTTLEQAKAKLLEAKERWSKLVKVCPGKRKKAARIVEKRAKGELNALEAEIRAYEAWSKVWTNIPGNKKLGWYCTKSLFGNEYCYNSPNTCAAGRQRHDQQMKNKKTECKVKRFAFCRGTERERWGGCYGTIKECALTARRKGQKESVCRPNYP